MRKTLLLIPLLALAGCAGPAESPGIPSANGGSATPKASASTGGSKDGGSRDGDGLKFAQCMRDNGLTWFEDPDPDQRGVRISVPEGVPKEKVDKAMEACKQYLPNGGEPGKVDPAITAKLRELAKCMRANGVPEFPDPNADGGLEIKSERGDNLDPHSEAFQKADKACAQYRPEGPDGGGETHEENG